MNPPDTIDRLPPNDALRQMMLSRQVRHPDGRVLTVTSTSSPHNYASLYRHVKSSRPELAVEIGMAHGASTLSILTGMAENETGQLVSIDPYPQWSSAMEATLHLIEQGGFSSRHSHVRDPSYVALPRLLDRHAGAVDLVYIDGQHTFDHAFIDCFYGDLLLRPGGVVAFNDCGWPSVFRVLKFLMTHRKYREIDVGAPREYRGGNWLKRLWARCQGRSSLDRYFQKLEDWSPPYNFYRRF